MGSTTIAGELNALLEGNDQTVRFVFHIVATLQISCFLVKWYSPVVTEK
jgi:hypothetical protein